MFKLDFSEEGFDNIILKNERNLVQVKTNVFYDEQAWEWKAAYNKKNNTCFNVLRLFHSKRSTYHQKFVCIHGDKRHKGIRKTYTG